MSTRGLIRGTSLRACRSRKKTRTLPQFLPLLHRMEERAGERRRIFLARTESEPVLSPTLSSLGGRRGGKYACRAIEVSYGVQNRLCRRLAFEQCILHAAVIPAAPAPAACDS